MPGKISILFIVVLLSGCSKPEIKEMMVSKALVSKHFDDDITVLPVTGGFDSPLSVKNKVFYKAIVSNLKNNKIFSSVNPKSGIGRYTLHADMIVQYARAEGWHVNYALNVIYVINDTKTKHKIFNYEINSRCEKTFNDTPGGLKRLNLAIECAVKHNIEAFIAKLNQVTTNAPHLALKQQVIAWKPFTKTRGRKRLVEQYCENWHKLKIGMPRNETMNLVGIDFFLFNRDRIKTIPEVIRLNSGNFVYGEWPPKEFKNGLWLDGLLVIADGYQVLIFDTQKRLMRKIGAVCLD